MTTAWNFWVRPPKRPRRKRQQQQANDTAWQAPEPAQPAEVTITYRMK